MAPFTRRFLDEFPHEIKGRLSVRGERMRAVKHQIKGIRLEGLVAHRREFLGVSTNSIRRAFDVGDGLSGRTRPGKCRALPRDADPVTGPEAKAQIEPEEVLP